MDPGVLVHHYLTVLKTFSVCGFQKTIDSGEPDLMLGINDSVSNLVAVFPFNGHALEFSSGVSFAGGNNPKIAARDQGIVQDGS